MMKSPKGGWLRSIYEADDDAGPDDLPMIAQAQTKDIDATLGDMAPGLEESSAFERLSLMAPEPASAPAVATDVDATRERDDIARGRDRDSSARLMRSIELAGKQFNSAVGGIPVGELVNLASTSYEKDATARADRGEAKRFARSQAEIAQAHRRAMLERQQRNDSLTAEQKRAAKERQDERDKKGDLEKDEDQALRKEQNKAMLALANANLVGTRKEREYRHGEDLEDDVKKLAKETGDTAPLIAEKLARVKEVLAKSPSDIPGVGPVDSRMPAIALSPEAQSIQSDAKELVNTLLFLQSGAGVSNTERDNKYRSYGVAEGSTEEAFRQGMAKIGSDIAKALKSKQAGFRPDVVEKFTSRGGVSSEQIDGATPVTKPKTVFNKATGETLQLVGGKWVPLK